MIKKVYVVTTKGRREGKLYQRLRAAQSLADHLAAFQHHHPVRILAFDCELNEDESTTVRENHE